MILFTRSFYFYPDIKSSNNNRRIILRIIARGHTTVTKSIDRPNILFTIGAGMFCLLTIVYNQG